MLWLRSSGIGFRQGNTSLPSSAGRFSGRAISSPSPASRDRGPKTRRPTADRRFPAFVRFAAIKAQLSRQSFPFPAQKHFSGGRRVRNPDSNYLPALHRVPSATLLAGAGDPPCRAWLLLPVPTSILTSRQCSPGRAILRRCRFCSTALEANWSVWGWLACQVVICPTRALCGTQRSPPI